MANIETPDLFPRVRQVLAVLALFIVLGAMVGSFLGIGIGMAQGLDYQQITGILNGESTGERAGFVRLFLGLNHLFMFLLPALATGWVFHKKDIAARLRLWPAPDWRLVGLGILFLVVAMPAVGYSYYVNQKIPLPEWARLMEDSTAETIKNLLTMGSPLAFLANVVVIALLPAVGEELVFRGVLQQQLMRRIASPHIAIWLTSAVFSGAHLQFEGFLPRMLLGAALGYLFYWTKNLWVNIVAHFLNNAVQVGAAYFFPNLIDSGELEKGPEVPVWAAAASLVLVYFLGKKIMEMRPPEPVAPPAEDRISLDDFR